MNQHWLSEPAGPLLSFGKALELESSDWSEREDLEQLTLPEKEVSRDVATALNLDQIIPLITAYGNALTCRFRLGDLVVLEVAPGLDEAALTSFRDKTRLSPTVVLELKLDKNRLTKTWLGEAHGSQLFLYCFPEAFERFLVSDLRLIETRLWRKARPEKAIVLVPSREIWLDGPYLTVIGGDGTRGWRKAITREPPDSERVETMYQTCRETLKWQESWLEYLTPLHLKVGGLLPPDDAIANALQVHLANLIILYTADRTVARDGVWIASYAGANQSVDLPLGDSGLFLEADIRAGAGALMRLVEWVYDPQ